MNYTTKYRGKSLQDIAVLCDKVRWMGKDTFTALCVAHDDRNPSMSVSEVNGTILFHCHAGCSQSALLDAFGLTGNREYRPTVNFVPRSRVDTSSTESRAERAVKLSTPAPDNHPYLVRKGIQPHGVGLLGGLYPDLPQALQRTRPYGDTEAAQNVLVIPMQNVHGKILSCQFIAEDGSKTYLSGSKQKGGFFFIRGNDRLWICEGFATGASLHEDTGDSVACAFDTGGLKPVTNALTAMYGSSRQILIMADDDWQTDGNPGLTKAQAAAQSNGVTVLQPDFAGLPRGRKHTDYNDLRVLNHG